MFSFDNQIASLFSLDLFRQICADGQLSIYKYNAFTTMLINNNIPFDVTFKGETRRNASSIQITVYVNSTMNLVFNIALGPGANDVNSPA